MKNLFYVLAVWLVFGLLISFPIAQVTTATFFFILALTSWFVYHYIYEIRRIRRAAYLEKTLNSDSAFQSLANSTWLKFTSAITAVLIAFSTLFVVAGFGRITNLPYVEWSLLFLSAPIFLMIYYLINRLLGKHVKAGHEFLMLRPAFWATFVILVASFTFIYIYFADLPRIQPLSWEALYLEQRDFLDTPLPWVGVLLAYKNTLQLSLITAMQLGSELDVSLAIKLGAWLLFIMLQGLKFALVWYVALGMLGYLWEQTSAQKTTASQFSKVFGYTLIIIFAFYLLVASINWPGVINQFKNLSNFVDSRDTRANKNICTTENTEAEMAEVMQKIEQELANQQALILAEIEQKVDQAIDKAFTNPAVENAIEGFLDWNFSIKGSYLQTFYKGKDLFDVGGLDAYLSSQFSERVGIILEQVLAEELAEVFQHTDSAVLAGFLNAQTNIAGYDASCLKLNQNSINLDGIEATYAGGGGLVAIMAARISARVVAQVGSRLATQLAAKIIAKSSAQLSARGASALLGAGAGAAACAATGPIAALCAGAAGVVMWFGSDYVIISLDEFMNRDELKSLIMETIAEQKTEVKNEINTILTSYVNDRFIDAYTTYNEKVRVIDLIGK